MAPRVGSMAALTCEPAPAQVCSSGELEIRSMVPCDTLRRNCSDAKQEGASSDFQKQGLIPSVHVSIHLVDSCLFLLWRSDLCSRLCEMISTGSVWRLHQFHGELSAQISVHTSSACAQRGISDILPERHALLATLSLGQGRSPCSALP